MEVTKDVRVKHWVSRSLCGAALVGALAWSGGWSGAAFAQGAPVVSRPVVQALPSADSKKLSAALSRIGRDPRDVASLIDAGDAARALQDYAAAIGFYRRADEITPGNAKIKAGLGSALALSGDPVAALPLFGEAEKAGALPSAIASDQGLAYDLVGDNVTAQRYYAVAQRSVTGAELDEVRMRSAVSHAISGDRDTAYSTLLPLLNRQDKPGWRTHAFTLAIEGDTGQAVEVVGKILPEQLAQNIAPYLRYMPRLTRAQQAAAANLGRFPRASEIGRDDARIAAYVPVRPAVGSGLIPKGEPLGGGTTKLAKAGKTGSTHTRPARGEIEQPRPSRPTQVASLDPDRVAPPEPKPTIERDGELPPIGRGAELPPVKTAAAAPVASAPVSRPATTPSALTATVPARTSPVSTPPATTTPAQVAAQTPVHTPAAPPAKPVASSGFDLGRMNASTASTPAPAPASTAPATTAAPPPVPGAGQLSLSEIFADIGRPTADAGPASGAVDIRLITPAAPPPRVQPVKVEEPKPEAAEPDDTKPSAKTVRGRADAEDAKADAAKGKGGKTADAKATDAKDAKSSGPKTKAEKAAEAKAKAAEAKAAEAKAKKPAPPSHPSRIWVQIGVGRNKDAIAFDWRRYLRESPVLLKGRQPYVSEMGRTNRILIGPFTTQKAATAFLADAKKQGFTDALPWTSPAGQVVDALSAK